MRDVMLLLTMIAATAAFIKGYKYGKKKHYMGPKYPSQASGFYMGSLMSGLVILASLAISWLFFK